MKASLHSSYERLSLETNTISLPMLGALQENYASVEFNKGSKVRLIEAKYVNIIRQFYTLFAPFVRERIPTGLRLFLPMAVENFLQNRIYK